MARKKQNVAPAHSFSEEEKRGVGFYIKKIFVHSCICYTAFVFLFSVIVALIDNSKIIYAADFVWLYALSLLVGCANLILGYKPLALLIRVLLHAISVFSGFAVYVVLVKQNDASGVAFLSIPFIVVYAIVMLGVLIGNSLIKKNAREKKSEYKSIYSNVNNSK